MNSKVASQISVLLLSLFLAACGTEEDVSSSVSSTSVTNAAVQTTIIEGAGIKGPLAFADAKLFALDTTTPDFYDKHSPVASAITNDFAQIVGLAVPRNLTPPFVLTIGGNQAIDLNTGTTPVIPTLITIVTKEMIRSGQPIYPTPLTTMVFEMVRYTITNKTNNKTFTEAVEQAANLVQDLFSIDDAVKIDVFHSPLMINNGTTTVSQQRVALHHRAAVEAFSAKIHALSLLSNTDSPAKIIERLAQDLQSDGTLDGSDNGTAIQNIDTSLINQDPMEMFIPNTDYKIKDTENLLEDERVYLGTANGPVFEKNSIELTTESTPELAPSETTTYKPAIFKPAISEPAISEPAISEPAISEPAISEPAISEPAISEPAISEPAINLSSNTLPLKLTSDDSEDKTLSVNVYKSSAATLASIRLVVYDADYANEGEMIINGNAPIPLFGLSGTRGNDSSSEVITITTPASYWNDGDNQVVFKHTNTFGFVIHQFDTSFLQIEPAPLPKVSQNSLNFSQEDVGSASNAMPITLSNVGTAPLYLEGISISSEFIETNNCSNYIPAGDSCIIEVSFLPTKSGGVTGTLRISSGDAVEPTLVNLSGIGSEMYSGNNVVRHVTFNSHAIGDYTEQDAIDDFDADQSTGKGWSHHTRDTDIVPDPSGNPSRGNVMRITHVADEHGGGPRFKGKLPVTDEYYLAYDLFIPADNELMMVEKLPGMIYGSMLEASHAYQEKPVPEGVKAFMVRTSLLRPGTYQARGDATQLMSYIYDADKVQYGRWFNTVDPVNSPNEGTYDFPQGEWVSIELHVKQNTATSQEGVGDKKDGVLQQWVNGVLAVDRHDMHWRTVNTMHIDGFSMYNYYGGPLNEYNEPTKTQYTYFDNFTISTSPITH